jgi:hypothetical protein
MCVIQLNILYTHLKEYIYKGIYNFTLQTYFGETGHCYKNQYKEHIVQIIFT